ncbi:MAG: 50S ribosomal protein L29 [Candidatus Beckwithbacteria bacterium]|nr:50S ribosomal protein L29 [Patescibacteria group bacterium]
MNQKDKQALQAKTTKELTADLLKLKKDLVDQKLKLKTGSLKDTSSLKKTRYQINIRLRTLRSSSS